MNRRRLDVWAAAATISTVVMIGVYLGLIEDQDGDAALWYVAMLVLGAVAAGYGAVTSLPHRRASLLAAGVLLVAAGLLGILTIGLPVLVAGVLCLVAAARPAPGG